MCRFRSQWITGTLEPKIYYIAIYLVCVCVYTCNMLGVHKFRANILTTCKGHHNRTLWCNYFFQNSLPIISYRLFNIFSKIFFSSNFNFWSFWMKFGVKLSFKFFYKCVFSKNKMGWILTKMMTFNFESEYTKLLSW